MLVILFLFFQLAFPAPLDLSLDLQTFSNLTAINRCSKSADWQAYAFLVEDCYTAIQQWYIKEIIQKPIDIFEFIGRGAQHRTKHTWIRTPIQITVNSCTLSIMMLDWFERRSEPLPGRETTGYQPTDTATFQDIYRAARLVEEDCLLPTRRPGWEVVGTKSSIGVFLWATYSSINEQVMGVDGNHQNGLPNLISQNMSNAATDSTK